MLLETEENRFRETAAVRTYYIYWTIEAREEVDHSAPPFLEDHDVLVQRTVEVLVLMMSAEKIEDCDCYLLASLYYRLVQSVVVVD